MNIEVLYNRRQPSPVKTFLLTMNYVELDQNSKTGNFYECEILYDLHVL